MRITAAGLSCRTAIASSPVRTPMAPCPLLSRAKVRIPGRVVVLDDEQGDTDFDH